MGVEVEEASKTDAGKVKDLDVSKKPDAAAKPKHIFEAGRLIITVFKARDIEKKGMFGKADPYVHITLGKQKAKSKTVKNNYNPEWNFDATFEVDQNTPETMRVDVFDEDLGKDDILGHKVLDISTVLEKKKLQNEWIPLDNCKSGEILLSAEFIPIANIQQSKHVEEQPTPDKPEEKDTKPKETVQDSEKSIPAVQTSEKPKEEMMTTDSAPSKPKRKLESGQIHLTVIKAKDIEKKGKFGKADPYVKIKYGKQKAKSKTVKNNHNPEWNFEATFDIDENSSEGLNIAVFDDDFGEDHSLGNKTMDIIDIQENMKVLNKWIPLENCKSGEVLLSAEFIPQASIQKAVDKSKAVDAKPIEENKEQIGAEIKEKIEVKDTTVVKQVFEESEAAKSIKPEREEETKEGKQQSSKATKIKESHESGTAPVSTPKNILEPGQVVLTVYKARDIEKKGKFGKADPYVKMTLGEQKAKSATVKNNHNPEWNFKATFDIHENTANEVIIAVYDEDFGKDDTLGGTVLDLNEVQDKKQLLSQWIPLKNCKSGEVLISAEFIPQAELQKRIQLEPSKSIDKREDTKKKSETTKQDTLVESSQEEVLIQKDVQIESTTAKGGKGLKEVLNREKKVSSETIVKPDQSIEPEVIIPKPREVEPGLISVTVHKARDIEKKGMFGKADPYVIMTHGDQKAKSKTIKNNCNPEWEFNAKFNIKKDAAEGIKISVFDDDIGKDDALGMKVLDIGSVQDYQQLKNQWIPLENCKSGEVLISAEFTPQALIEEAEQSVVVQSPEAETKDVAKAESEDKKKKDVVKVEVEEASKTDAGKVKDLDVSKKPDAAAKPKI